MSPRTAARSALRRTGDGVGDTIFADDGVRLREAGTSAGGVHQWGPTRRIRSWTGVGRVAGAKRADLERGRNEAAAPSFPMRLTLHFAPRWWIGTKPVSRGPGRSGSSASSARRRRPKGLSSAGEPLTGSPDPSNPLVQRRPAATPPRDWDIRKKRRPPQSSATNLGGHGRRGRSRRTGPWDGPDRRRRALAARDLHLVPSARRDGDVGDQAL